MKQTQEHIETRSSVQAELDYLLCIPDTQSSGENGFPLLLFLHGMGERGCDLSLVKKHGPPLLIEGGAEFPFIVVSPQCAADAVWHPDVLMALVDDLVERLHVDNRRLYVTGLSMGGSGTWALANAYPDRFAAIAPVCGPFTMVEPTNFSTVPVWCFHGAMDGVVPVSDSVRMVRWLRENGADVRCTIYPDAKHDSWTETYTGNELYNWLLTNSRQ
jgi:predicted peptidase